jgi:lipopolysaccharide transport system ATP-binding protein
MSETIIKVENLSKQYRIGSREGYRTFRETLVDAAKAPFQRITGIKPHSQIRDLQSETIWALKDVSFEVKQGEVVGIIGRNGAGKSTLLKVLSKITEPTEGRVELRGRVGSLLEVGTGFHPELTGHENVYLYGAILGMDRWEVSRKFDEIVAFAELEKFIDTPVKRYSSGMYMRLAFAVAAHLEPEILLVDEVLAVGDAAFQKKCLGKVGDVSKAGRTVLFVSHNMGAITRLCERSFWLDEGEIVLEGLSGEVINSYQSQYLTARGEWKGPDPEEVASDFAFLSVSVMDEKGQSTTLFGGEEPISIEICYIVRRPLAGCQIGCRIYNSDGIVIMTTTDCDNSGASALPKEPGLYRSMFKIPGNFLAPGTYSLLLSAHLPKRNVYKKQQS